MRLPKKLLLALLGLLLVPVLLVGALFLLLWLDTDHQQLRQQLQHWVEQQTGYQLRIDGDLHLSLFPQLQVNAQSLQLSGAGLDQPLVLDSLAVNTDALALLQGKLEVENVQLTGLQLSLQRDPDGHIQLPFAGNNSAEAGQSSEPSGPIGPLPVRELRLLDSRLHIPGPGDEPALSVNLHAFELLRQDDSTTAVTGRLDFVLGNGQHQQLAGETKLSASVANDWLQINQLQAQTSLTRNQSRLGLLLQGELLRLTANGELVQARNWHLHSETLPLSLQLNADQRGTDLAVKLMVDQFNPARLLSWLSPEPHPVPDLSILQQANGELQLLKAGESWTIDILDFQFDETRVQGAVDYATEQQHSAELKLQLKLDDLALAPYLDWLVAWQSDQQPSEAASLRVEAAVHINRLRLPEGEFEPFISQLTLDNNQLVQAAGSVRAEGVNPAALLLRYPQWVAAALTEIVSENAIFTSLDGEVDYAYDPAQFSLTGMELTLDQTSLVGELRYDFDTPAVFAELFVGALDTENYLPLFATAAAESQQASVNEHTGPANNEQDLSAYLDWLKQLKGEGQVHVEQLVHDGVSYRDILLDFNSATQK